MITKTTLMELREANHEAYRAFILNLRRDFDIANASLATHYDELPTESAAKLIDRLGVDSAVRVVASAVNRVGDWDARIFPSVREWAESRPEALNREAGDDRCISLEMHPVHLNQLAEALIKLTR